MELKELKQINNGMIPTEKPTIEEKVVSGIGVEGTTGLSTLTDRKYISNLPKYSVGKVVKSINAWGNKDNAMFGSNAGAVMSAAPAAIDFVGSIASGTKYNKTADDLLQDAGSAEGNIGGVSYQTLNDINASQVAAQEHAENKANTIGLMGKGASLGASIGSVAGPVGGLIGGAVGAIGGLVGGLFGGGKRHAAMRRRIAEAQDKALRQNDFSRNGALTSVLQLNYAREYGDTESQSLYGFKEGKPALMPSGEFVPNKMLTAWGSNGEVMVQRDGAGNVVAASQIGRGNDNKDTVPIVVDNNTEIYTNKQVEIAPGIKVRPSEYFKNTGDANGANYLTAMNIQRKKFKNGKLPGFVDGISIENNPYYKDRKALDGYINYMQNDSSSLFRNYKNGKLPGFAWGLPEWMNMATNSIGMISSLTDKSKIDNEPISRPNTRKTNPYADSALNILAQQSFNPYSGYRDIYDVQDKRTYATRNNAGMSAAQRAVAEYAGYNDAMQNLAKFNQYAQEKNSALASAYANTRLLAGENQSTRDMHAEQFDYDAYNQAHGAKMLMSSQRQADAMNYLNNFTRGIIDMHNWRKMYKLYEEDVKNRKNNNSNTANTVKSWGDIYNDMGINKTADYADTTSDAAWTNSFRKKFNPTPLSEEERYARNIENLGLNSLFYTPPMPENYINPLKYISTRRSNKRKNKKS